MRKTIVFLARCREKILNHSGESKGTHRTDNITLKWRQPDFRGSWSFEFGFYFICKVRNTATSGICVTLYVTCSGEPLV